MTRAAILSTQDGSMGDEMYPSKPGHGTLSHLWPGSPLHQRAETGPRANVAEDGEDGEAATSISRDLALGLETPMLDVCIPAELEVRNRTLHRHCQAPPGGGHVLELPAIQISALEVRTTAGVDHYRDVPARTGAVQTKVA
jgi:hypothetical protein